MQFHLTQQLQLPKNIFEVDIHNLTFPLFKEIVLQLKKLPSNIITVFFLIIYKMCFHDVFCYFALLGLLKESYSRVF